MNGYFYGCVSQVFVLHYLVAVTERRESALIHEPSWLSQLVLFPALPETLDAIEARHLFLDLIWYVRLTITIEDDL